MWNRGRVRGFFWQLMGRRALRPMGKARLLILVEGRHDVSFLTGIGSLLRRGDDSLPDLRALGESGEVVFVPIGGGDFVAWANRLAPLDLPEIHLLDREMPPDTALRRQAAQIVNQREHCRAFITGNVPWKTTCIRIVCATCGGSTSDSARTTMCLRSSRSIATNDRRPA